MTALAWLRRVLVEAWPFLASIVVVAVVTGATIVSLTVIAQRNDLRRNADQLAYLAGRAKAASETNTRLLEAQQPCDPAQPESLACVRKAAGDKVVADAIGRINKGTEQAINAHARAAEERFALIERRFAEVLERLR